MVEEGEHILEYLGEKISKAESLVRCEAENWFIFYLDEEFDIDGNVDWNPARFANHSCAPNCEVECIEGHLWMIAKKRISAGEELTYNYGYDLGDYPEHPCHCGAGTCLGYILAEEFRYQIRSERSL